MRNRNFQHIAVQELATTACFAQPPLDGNDLLLSDPSNFMLAKLKMFADEVKKSLRGGACVQIYSNFEFGRFYRSLAKKACGGAGTPVGVVYYPEEAYIRGYITFADIRSVAIEDAPTFNVHSPCIQIERLPVTDISRYTAKAKHLKQGVANACKWLTEFDAEMIFSVAGTHAAVAQRKSHKEVSDAVDKAVKTLSGNNNGHVPPSLVREIKHLHATQHKFVDAQFGKIVEAYLQASQELEEFRTHISKCFYMVSITERCKQPWFSVSRIKETPKTDASFSSAIDTCEYNRDSTCTLQPEYKVLSEMPDNLMGKMSVLAVMGVNTYIKDVGVKINDNVYFLYGGDE